MPFILKKKLNTKTRLHWYGIKNLPCLFVKKYGIDGPYWCICVCSVLSHYLDQYWFIVTHTLLQNISHYIMSAIILFILSLHALLIKCHIHNIYKVCIFPMYWSKHINMWERNKSQPHVHVYQFICNKSKYTMIQKIFFSKPQQDHQVNICQIISLSVTNNVISSFPHPRNPRLAFHCFAVWVVQKHLCHSQIITVTLLRVRVLKRRRENI